MGNAGASRVPGAQGSPWTPEPTLYRSGRFSEESGPPPESPGRLRPDFQGVGQVATCKTGQMASLLELSQQGDVATIADDAYLKRTLQLMGPQQLYELWERQQWQSQSIELERDREDWARMSDADKDEILWGLSSFFVGEERVTTQFSGLVMAYEDEQEEAFLTTQQVDEARHMQFFDRYYREAFDHGDEDIGGRLERTRQH